MDVRNGKGAASKHNQDYPGVAGSYLSRGLFREDLRSLYERDVAAFWEVAEVDDLCL